MINTSTLSQSELFDALKSHGIYFNPAESLQFSLYELVEIIVKSFSLAEDADAYIQYFLDVVLDYTLSHDNGLTGFLEYFDAKKDKLSISSLGESKGRDGYDYP